MSNPFHAFRPKSLLLFVHLCCTAFALHAQDGKDEYKGRRHYSITHEKLLEATQLNELSPELWHRMELNFSERDRLNKMLHMQHSLFFSLVSAQESEVVYPNTAYEKMVDYVGFEISVISQGKMQRLAAQGKILSVAQKNLLKNADLGNPVVVKVKYYYLKDGRNPDKIHEGTTTLEPLPFFVAEYAGGNKAITNYLQSRVLDKITTPLKEAYPFFATVRFTVDETGKVVQVKIIEPSHYPEIDALLQKAIQQMPGWRAARDTQNKPVKETFTFNYPFVDGC